MLIVVFIGRLTVSNSLQWWGRLQLAAARSHVGGAQEKDYGLMRAGRRAKKRTGDGQT